MVEELYTVFREPLLRYCRSVTNGDEAGAEDLVQETFLRAMEHLEELEALRRAQRQAWLCRTALHLYIDRWRKLRRETLAEGELLEQTPFRQDFSAAAVTQLVDRLPEEERTLFRLRYFQGYNARELGGLFSLPPSTVRSRLAAARRRLAHWLE